MTVGVPVPDLGEARAWYTRVLGREPDLAPVPRIVEFEVVPGSWLQLVERPPAGEAAWVFRIGVGDIEAERTRLLALGVGVDPVERIEGVIAYCDYRDPYGNRLSAYQDLTT